MKQLFSRQLIIAAAASLVLFSCKKSDDFATELSSSESPASAKAPSAAAVTRVSKITSDFIPVTSFTYDSKGRLASSTAEYHTTYTYGKGTLTIKTVHPATGAVRALLTGKVNGKGLLTDLNGFTVSDEVQQDKKYSFTYDAAGQLTKMDLASTAEGVTTVQSVSCVWQNGNLVKQTNTYNGAQTIEWTYQYGPQPDKTGLRNAIIDVWSDGFLGKLNSNHVSAVFISSNGQMSKYSDNSWSVDANGFATSTVATMYSGGGTYSVGSQYFY